VVEDIQGTIVSGTMRNEDIIPELYSYLASMYPNDIVDMANSGTEYVETLTALKKEISTIEIREDWDSEYASEVCLGLFDAITEFIPEGYYCGSHPGDGSDFGIWRYEDND